MKMYKKKHVYIISRYNDAGELIFDSIFFDEATANKYVVDKYGKHYLSDGLATIKPTIIDIEG